VICGFEELNYRRETESVPACHGYRSGGNVIRNFSVTLFMTAAPRLPEKIMHLLSATIHHELFPTREQYPFTLAVLQETKGVSFSTPVTCFVGENGSGKSTFLKAIARCAGIYLWGEIDRERFERNPFEDQFYRVVSVEWVDGPAPGSFFDSQTFRNFTRLVDEWAVADPAMLDYYGGRSLVTQSHGQSLMAYFRNRYSRRGIYFLDEPETALSPRTQVALRDLIAELAVQGRAQFIMATHSPILLSLPDTLIYSFDQSPIKDVQYHDTDHYRVYRDFMKIE